MNRLGGGSQVNTADNLQLGFKKKSLAQLFRMSSETHWLVTVRLLVVWAVCSGLFKGSVALICYCRACHSYWDCMPWIVVVSHRDMGL